MQVEEAVKDDQESPILSSAIVSDEIQRETHAMS
jgi:hypothetical protein